MNRLYRFFRHAKGNFYRKSLVLILLSASIPGLVIGGSVYWIVSAKIESALIESHQKQILEQSRNMDEQLNYLELTLSHWAFEPRFGESLQTLDFVYHFAETRDIYKTLLVMQGSHPLIKGVELFIDRPSPVRFNPEYNPPNDQSQITYFKQLLSRGGTAYWTNSSQVAKPSASNDALLVHKIMDMNQNPFGVLVATLNREKVENMLKVLNPYDKGASFLMNRQNEIFAAVQSGASSPNEFEAAIKEAVMQVRDDERAFSFKWNGDDYSVSVGKLPRIDTEWTYVSATPISAITSPIIFVSELILLFSISGFALALALSWFASNRIYSPVKRLMNVLAGGKAGGWSRNLDEFQLLEKQWGHLSRESSLLQSKLQEQLPHIREGFLLQLFHQYLNRYSEQELKNRMKQYGWETDGRQFIVTNVQLTGFSQSDGRFTHDDRGLATFAAANIIQELAASRLKEFSVINFHDSSIGLLVFASDAASARMELLAMSKELTQTINQILYVRVTITIGKPTDLVRNIPAIFEEASQVSWARIMKDANQIIDMEQPDAALDLGAFQYPFALERDIVQAMRMGQQNDVERLLEQFLNEVADGGNKEAVVKQSLLLLVGSMQHMIMLSGIRLRTPLEGANVFDSLLQTREREQIIQLICTKVANPFIEAMAERTNTQVQKIIEQAIRYLETNYTKDISLDSCADQLGTNPFTLSKSFKQVTGINFIDYVTDLRLNKAKELLRETDMKMNDIAESVGYQQTYFNRIFKKQEGITPSQYRDKSRDATV
ncbi:AraC family transcriptional regulator [Paenibacillus contaminans]|uniref:AraC family transcriptional regulator n=1 Tax=Paenibacillus contaminans TaxID=450362 RepID=A0A329MIA1_9BACL|nr:AraC family transcriptional regulator [Paenibacillus contaminans]RAV17307.1 AraC family transcriptional regulator [Paenibacillus contaminans]